jgi:uncharacterized protein YxjI
MPITLSCAPCGTAFNVKDEHAGGRFQCPKCKGELKAPAAAGAAARPPQEGHAAFDRDKFLLRQKVFSISEKYSLSDENETPILWVERPARLLRGLAAIGSGLAVAFVLVYAGIAIGGAAMAVLIPLGLIGGLVVALWMNPKRHVTFYSDEAMTVPVLKAFQDQRFVLLTATYSVTTGEDAPLAKLEKNHIHNILRKKWVVYRPDGAIWAVAREDSILLALLRRFLGTFYGLLRTNFIICRGDSEDVIGEFNRKLAIRDHYALDMSADGGRHLDRRVAAALGVLLDTGESR